MIAKPAENEGSRLLHQLQHAALPCLQCQVLAFPIRKLNCDLASGSHAGSLQASSALPHARPKRLHCRPLPDGSLLVSPRWIASPGKSDYKKRSCFQHGIRVMVLGLALPALAQPVTRDTWMLCSTAAGQGVLGDERLRQGGGRGRGQGLRKYCVQGWALGARGQEAQGRQ